MSWVDVKAGAGAYLKMDDDGVDCKVVVLGEAEVIVVDGLGGKKNTRVYVNAATAEDVAAGETCSILGLNVTTGEALAELLKVSCKRDGTPKYKPTESLVGKVWVHIVRHGKKSSQATTYELVVLKKVTPAEAKVLANLQLRDLTKCGTFKSKL